jgi:hypothetical protein
MHGCIFGLQWLLSFQSAPLGVDFQLNETSFEKERKFDDIQATSDAHVGFGHASHAE